MMWSEDKKRMFLLKLRIVGRLFGLLLTLIVLTGMMVGICIGAYHFLFKMSDHDRFVTMLVVLPIFLILGVVLEWPNLCKFKIGNYFNKNHIASKLIRGYIKTWIRFVFICWGGVLGVDILLIGGFILLKNVGFSDNIGIIIAAIPTIIFAISYIIWAKKYQPLSYSDFFKKNASMLEEKVFPPDSVRDLLSELDDPTKTKKNSEPH